MIKSIRAKLLIWFLCFFIFNIIIVIISLIYMKEKDEIENMAHNIKNVELLLLKDVNTINKFYIQEVSDPIFYITKNSYNLEEHNIYLSGLRNRLHQIINSDIAGEFGLKNTLREIYDRIDSIDVKFLAIIDLQYHNGYMEYGLVGELNQSILELQKILSVSLLSEVLMQDDELSIKGTDEGFYVNINDYKERAIKKLNNARYISLNKRKDAVNYLEKYYNLYMEIVRVDEKVGLNGGRGLKKEIEDLQYSISDEAAQINDKVTSRKQEIFKAYRNSYILSMVLILILGLTLSFYSSNKNSERIILLANSIKKFVDSKFTQVENIEKEKENDEVSNLISNFKVLQNEIINHINNLEELVKERTIKIEEQNAEIISQRDEVLHQKEFIESQNKRLFNSIRYAKRIQEALMHDAEYISQIFPDSFVFLKPKSLVSGDFYWVRNINSEEKNLSCFAAIDCTGHGVPGALMSMLGISFLNDIVKNGSVSRPSNILEELRKRVILSLGNNGRDVQDGMDVAFCILDHESKKLQYSGAYRPLFIIRNKELIEYKGDRVPIGKYIKSDRYFTNTEIEVLPGDKIYIFSDGVVDQLGNGNGKEKFKKHRLIDLLLDNHEKTMNEQKNILENTIASWQGNSDQTDDILVMGITVN